MKSIIFVPSVLIIFVLILFISNKIRLIKKREIDNRIFNLSQESTKHIKN